MNTLRFPTSPTAQVKREDQQWRKDGVGGKAVSKPGFGRKVMGGEGAAVLPTGHEGAAAAAIDNAPLIRPLSCCSRRSCWAVGVWEPQRDANRRDARPLPHVRRLPTLEGASLVWLEAFRNPFETSSFQGATLWV